MSDLNFKLMLRWQWWIVIIALLPAITFSLSMFAAGRVLEFVSDKLYSLSVICMRAGSFKPPPLFVKMLRFAKGQ